MTRTLEELERDLILLENRFNSLARLKALSLGDSAGAEYGQLKLSGQIVSEVATGTEPATIQSTTKVTNLNADLLDGNEASAFALAGAAPAAHHTSHESGGSDAVKLDDLAAPDDNTDLNVSTAKHGLVPKAPNDTAKYLRGDATWGTPPTGGDVLGPSISVSHNLVSFNGTTGKVIEDSGYKPADFAPAAKGVTNGDSHDHAGGDGAQVPTLGIADEAVTLAKMQHISSARILGRTSADPGDVEQLAASTVRTLLNVEDGADVTDAVNVANSIAGVSALTAIDDADQLALIDNSDSSALKKITYASVKTLLSALYAAITHASRHQSGGADAIKLDDLAAPDDNTDLDGSSTKHGLYPKADASKLAGVEASADVTDAGNVGSTIHGASAKTTPVDADETALIDSAASNALKKLTWANVKATLKTYFDGLYPSTSDGGWMADADTWVQVSANSFKIEGKDVTARFQVGTRLKFTQTTVKYAVSIGAAMSGSDTLVTVFAGSDYTIAAAAITSPCYSYDSSPVNYPSYFNWTPVWVSGEFSADPSTVIARVWVIGRLCFWFMKSGGDGTSSATTKRLIAPITPVGGSGSTWGGICWYAKDNGSALTGNPAAWSISQTSGYIAFDKVWGTAGGWTASGACRIYAQGFYEI